MLIRSSVYAWVCVEKKSIHQQCLSLFTIAMQTRYTRERQAPGAQQNFEGEGQISESEYQSVRVWVRAPQSRVSPTYLFWKTYMRIGVLYCICCIEIINLENFKVLLFSLVLFEEYIQLYKNTGNYNVLLFAVVE